MNQQRFQASLLQPFPPSGLTPPLEALWWDSKGDWQRAHALVDDLETPAAMAVHAYLHRKGNEHSNADYWYAQAGREHYRPSLEEEWHALAEALLTPP